MLKKLNSKQTAKVREKFRIKTSGHQESQIHKKWECRRLESSKEKQFGDKVTIVVLEVKPELL